MQSLLIRDGNSRRTFDRKVNGLGNKAESMNVRVKLKRSGLAAAFGDSHPRFKQHPNEGPRSVVRLFHNAFGIVLVVDNAYAIHSAQVEVPQHVAGRETAYQEIFGTVTGSIAPKTWIARTGNLRFALDLDHVIASIPLVGLSPLAFVASPIDSNVINVLLHGSFRFVRIKCED